MKLSTVLILQLFCILSLCKKERREVTRTTKSSLETKSSAPVGKIFKGDSVTFILSDGNQTITQGESLYKLLSNPPLLPIWNSGGTEYDLSTVKEQCFMDLKRYIISKENVGIGEECIGEVFMLCSIFNIKNNIQEFQTNRSDITINNNGYRDLIFKNRYLSAANKYNTKTVQEYGIILEELRMRINKVEEQDKERRLNYYSKNIHEDLLITDLLNAGFTTVYNKSYGHKSTKEELLNIKYNIGKNKSLPICVGALRKEREELALAACGLLDEVFALTRLQYKARYTRGVYWYFLIGKSFGFAPSHKITMKYGTDVEDDGEELRMSWKIDGKNGGWRVGEEDQIYTNEWRKIIFIQKLG